MGFKLTEVTAGSEAEKAGLKVGDEIVAVNGHKVASPDQIVGVSNVGSVNAYSVIRDGSELTMNVNGTRLEAKTDNFDVEVESSVSPTSAYNFTKSLSKFGFAVCLLIAIAGVLMTVISMIEGEGERFVTGLVLIVLGFAGMMSAQLTVALVETADNSREIVSLLRKREL